MAPHCELRPANTLSDNPQGYLLGAASSDGHLVAPCPLQLAGTGRLGSKEILGGSGEGLGFLWILELTGAAMMFDESHLGQGPDHKSSWPALQMSKSFMVTMECLVSCHGLPF